MNYDQINQKPLDYRSDLAQTLFSPIEHLNWSMLLRSASEDHIDSRFDILVAQPIAKITTRGESSFVVTANDEYQTEQDPFELLDSLQQQYLPQVQCDSELPFVGGSLGYFSYDLGRRIENMPELASDELSTPDMAVGLYDWAIVVDHKLKRACIVGKDIDLHWDWLQSQQSTPKTHTDFSLVSPWQSNMDKEAYSNKFASVQDYIVEGDCYQINLAQRFCAEYRGSEWQAYLKLEKNNLAPFSAFIRTEDSTILSVSPERFLQLENREIETKPIKGTMPRSSDELVDNANKQKLKNSEKDQAENLMIVDLLRNDIGRVAQVGSVHVPNLFDIESFPAVHHLVSTVKAKLDEQYSATDLLRAGFPGGSITGAPKIRAMEIIEELEPHRRNVYCGSIGYISRHGKMDTSITIRTLIAENNTIYAWAGGGLVADSQCDAEYQETLDKLSKILPVL
ncbi:aminodeoxychorismate synthase component I [Vibrio marisflavi]|uniref:aminodeoxychorismate synthase n=1 Tax=Vibrio marisflavi CECT 7928 TaxID=634439 RepID=A0ABN8E3A3_9VIBR|nr:aminodeoxychorismate synthase component I [Vibrio marisflavi]CAH0539584.1 Aminodeoxychorismate synthase component 1 [Vibrio marisflavi CECT 7928]